MRSGDVDDLFVSETDGRTGTEIVAEAVGLSGMISRASNPAGREGRVDIKTRGCVTRSLHSTFLHLGMTGFG